MVALHRCFEQRVVSAVEERELSQGREDLQRGLTTANSEAHLLRTDLAEVQQHLFFLHRIYEETVLGV